MVSTVLTAARQHVHIKSSGVRVRHGAEEEGTGKSRIGSCKVAPTCALTCNIKVASKCAVAVSHQLDVA